MKKLSSTLNGCEVWQNSNDQPVIALQSRNPYFVQISHGTKLDDGKMVKEVSEDYWRVG